MKKYINSILLFLVAFVAVYFIANYIVNFGGIFKSNSEVKSQFDYFNNFSVYYNNDTDIYFDYPANWSFSSSTDGDKKIDKIYIDEYNYLEILNYPLEDDVNYDIEEYVKDDYNQIKSSYLINKYEYNSSGTENMFGYDVSFFSLSNGKSYYDKYSWFTNDNYFTQITFAYEAKYADEFSTLKNSISISSSSNDNYFESSNCSVSFYYPSYLVYLGTSTAGDKNKIINENFASDEKTSITVSTTELDKVAEKDFFNTIVVPFQEEETKKLIANGYSCRANGLTSVFNKEFYFYYLDYGTHHYNSFYWYEERNNKPIGCRITFRYENTNRDDFLEVVRSISFGE